MLEGEALLVFDGPLLVGVVADSLLHHNECGEEFTDLVGPLGTAGGELAHGRLLALAVAGDELLS